MTKPSFSNSAKRYYSHLADSVLEPSLIRSALVYQYLYKKYFRSRILIFKRVLITLTTTIWVMLDLACVAGGILVFLGLVPGEIFFYFCSFSFLMVHVLSQFVIIIALCNTCRNL